MGSPFDWLEEQAKSHAKEVMGTMAQVSILKDYLVLKTSNQANINLANGECKADLDIAIGNVDQQIKGQTGDAAKALLGKIKSKSYYNEGQDSIHL